MSIIKLWFSKIIYGLPYNACASMNFHVDRYGHDVAKYYKAYHDDDAYESSCVLYEVLYNL